MELLTGNALVVAAPAQNRPGYEHAVERALPLFTVRLLHALRGETQHIDLWNNIGAKMDASFVQEQSPATDRASYSQRLIAERYTFYEEVGLVSPDEDRTVIADDWQPFSRWSEEYVEDLVKTGKVYQDRETMHVCDGCDMALCVMTDDRPSDPSCNTCFSTTNHIEERTSWFLDVDATPPSVILPRKAKHAIAQSKNIPERVSIERNRLYGTSLEGIGSEYVLDPKLGLALMPGYVSEMTGRSDFIMVQGMDTLYNTAPYTQTFFPDFNMNYILTARVPSGVSRKVIELTGVGFWKNYVPGFLLDRASDVPQTLVENLHQEYTNANAYMQKMAGLRTIPSTDTAEGAIEESTIELRDALELIDGREVRQGILKIRNAVVKTMGRAGLFEAIFDDDQTITNIKETIANIYG